MGQGFDFVDRFGRMFVPETNPAHAGIDFHLHVDLSVAGRRRCLEKLGFLQR